MSVILKKSGDWVMKKIIPLTLANAVAVFMASPLLASEEDKPVAYAGIIPEGIWVLNQERSKKLKPGAHTLWIIKDDGHRLAWVSVEADPDERVRVTSWDGFYNGPAVVVAGSGMVTKIMSSAKGKMSNHGDIPNLGSYAEECTVMSNGRRMKCEFTLTTPEGVKTYIDDFDWHSEGPLMFLPGK